jgi:hypothetical protein
LKFGELTWRRVAAWLLFQLLQWSRMHDGYFGNVSLPSFSRWAALEHMPLDSIVVLVIAVTTLLHLLDCYQHYQN